MSIISVRETSSMMNSRSVAVRAGPVCAGAVCAGAGAPCPGTRAGGCWAGGCCCAGWCGLVLPGGGCGTPGMGGGGDVTCARTAKAPASRQGNNRCITLIGCKTPVLSSIQAALLAATTDGFPIADLSEGAGPRDFAEPMHYRAGRRRIVGRAAANSAALILGRRAILRRRRRFRTHRNRRLVAGFVLLRLTRHRAVSPIEQFLELLVDFLIAP